MKELKYLSPTELWSIRKRKKASESLQSNPNVDHIPGALVYTGDSTDTEVYLELICYDENGLTEERLNLSDIASSVEKPGTKWLNVVGLYDTKVIREIGDQFNIHNLVLEDILHVQQRPVFEEYDHYFFMAAKMLNINQKAVLSEQLSIVTGEGFIITFQERPGDVFDSVRKRLRTKSGLIRTRKSDYLAFALLDVIVDHYMDIVDLYGDEVNDQEIQLLERTDKAMLSELNLSKREINYLRKYVRPLKDAIVGFQKSELPFIEKRTRPFIKDLMSHINQVAENIELYRDTINDNLGTYHLSMSNKLNDILKVLTIFSVIFIPLTFLAGIYGMNFEHMPELSKPYAYPIFLSVLVILALGMILYFKKKKWI